MATILNLYDKYGAKGLAEASKPWALSPIPRAEYRDTEGLLRVRTVPGLGLLATSMSAEPNRSIVHRSWGLIDGGIFYGPTFRYSEYMKVSNTFMAMLGNLALAAAVFMLSLSSFRSVHIFLLSSLQLLLIRLVIFIYRVADRCFCSSWLIQKVVRAPGSGPDVE